MRADSQAGASTVTRGESGPRVGHVPFGNVTRAPRLGARSGHSACFLPFSPGPARAEGSEMTLHELLDPPNVAWTPDTFPSTPGGPIAAPPGCGAHGSLPPRDVRGARRL
jgi:hypothetical protein